MSRSSWDKNLRQIKLMPEASQMESHWNMSPSEIPFYFENCDEMESKYSGTWALILEHFWLSDYSALEPRFLLDMRKSMGYLKKLVGKWTKGRFGWCIMIKVFCFSGWDVLPWEPSNTCCCWPISRESSVMPTSICPIQQLLKAPSYCFPRVIMWNAIRPPI